MMASQMPSPPAAAEQPSVVLVEEVLGPTRLGPLPGRLLHARGALLGYYRIAYIGNTDCVAPVLG